MKKNKIIKFYLSLIFAQFLLTTPAFSNAAEKEEVKLRLDNIDSSRFFSVAVLQILNKTTAKTSVVEIKIGESIEIGKLTIKAKKCWQAPLDQRPDNRILLEISEEKTIDQATERKKIFHGWIFSSSPSISSLEHPVYDVTALHCKNK